MIGERRDIGIIKIYFWCFWEIGFFFFLKKVIFDGNMIFMIFNFLDILEDLYFESILLEVLKYEEIKFFF